MTIIKSPTRVDFSGGTIDCWPLFAFLGPSFTINLSIDILTRASFKKIKGSKISVELMNLKFKKEFADCTEFLSCKDEHLQLLINAFRSWPLKGGYEIALDSQSPIGGGLGGSSSLLISILLGLGKVSKKKLALVDLVRLAHNIEAQVLSTPTGTQDYVPAAQAGLNAIHYDHSGMKVEKLKFDKKLFDSKMLLVYTGKPHHSGLNNWSVIKNAVEKDLKTLKSLEKIREISSNMYSVCKKKDWHQLPALFTQDYIARTELSAGFSSPEIRALEKMVLAKGAEAIKICGAGGGGCVLVWCPAEKKKSISKVCTDSGYTLIEAKSVI